MLTRARTCVLPTPACSVVAATDSLRWRVPLCSCCLRSAPSDRAAPSARRSASVSSQACRLSSGAQEQQRSCFSGCVRVHAPCVGQAATRNRWAGASARKKTSFVVCLCAALQIDPSDSWCPWCDWVTCLPIKEVWSSWPFACTDISGCSVETREGGEFFVGCRDGRETALPVTALPPSGRRSSLATSSCVSTVVCTLTRATGVVTVFRTLSPLRVRSRASGCASRIVCECTEHDNTTFTKHRQERQLLVQLIRSTTVVQCGRLVPSASTRGGGS